MIKVLFTCRSFTNNYTVPDCAALSKMEELLMEMKMDVTKLPAELSKMPSVSVQLKMDEYSTISKLAKSSAQPPISQSVITQAPPTSTSQTGTTVTDVSLSKSPSVTRKETAGDKKPQATPVASQKTPSAATYQVAYTNKATGNAAAATQVQLAPGSGLAVQTAQGNIVVYSVASSVNSTQTVSIVQGGSVVGNASTVSTNSTGQTFTIGVPAYIDGSNLYQTVQLVPTAGSGTASAVVSGSQHVVYWPSASTSAVGTSQIAVVPQGQVLQQVQLGVDSKDTVAKKGTPQPSIITID